MADTARQAHSRQDLEARPKTKGWTQQGGTQGGHMADKFWGARTKRTQGGHRSGGQVLGARPKRPQKADTSGPIADKL